MWSVRVYVCIFTSMYIYIHLCRREKQRHTCAHTYIDTYVRTYIHTYTHKCVYMHTIRLRSCVPLPAHMCSRRTYTVAQVSLCRARYSSSCWSVYKRVRFVIRTCIVFGIRRSWQTHILLSTRRWSRLALTFPAIRFRACCELVCAFFPSSVI